MLGLCCQSFIYAWSIVLKLYKCLINVIPQNQSQYFFSRILSRKTHAHNRSYTKCGLDKCILTFSVFSAEQYLRFLYSAQHCTYICLFSLSNPIPSSPPSPSLPHHPPPSAQKQKTKARSIRFTLLGHFDFTFGLLGLIYFERQSKKTVLKKMIYEGHVLFLFWDVFVFECTLSTLYKFNQRSGLAFMLFRP